MLTLPFTQNWNGKLFQDVFGTVRLANESWEVDAEAEVTLRGTSLGIVKVVCVNPFPFHALRDPLAFLDTGKPAHYMGSILQKMYGHKPHFGPQTMLEHIIVEYIDRNLDVHEAMLKEWWQKKIEEQKGPVQQSMQFDQ